MSKLTSILVHGEGLLLDEVMKAIRLEERGIAFLTSQRFSKPISDLILMEQPQALLFQVNSEDDLELLNAINVDLCPVIVFGASAELAVAAFGYNVLGFLRYPYSRKQVKVTLQKLGRYLQNRIRKKTSELFSGDKLRINNLSGFRLVSLLEIVHMEAAVNYTHIHLFDGSVIVATRTLKQFETLLYHHGFFRCHRSHLINLRYMRDYISTAKGKYIVMTDGTRIELSKARISELEAMADGLFTRSI